MVIPYATLYISVAMASGTIHHSMVGNILPLAGGIHGAEQPSIATRMFAQCSQKGIGIADMV
jgi:hypothetical protein